MIVKKVMMTSGGLHGGMRGNVIPKGSHILRSLRIYLSQETIFEAVKLVSPKAGHFDY